MDAQTQENLTHEQAIDAANKMYDASPEMAMKIKIYTENLEQIVREQQKEIERLSNENSLQSDEIRHYRSELALENNDDDVYDDEKPECDYCGEYVDKIHGTPFMAEAGAVMCRECWNMTREEYIGSEGTDIGLFDDTFDY